MHDQLQSTPGQVNPHIPSFNEPINPKRQHCFLALAMFALFAALIVAITSNDANGHKVAAFLVVSVTFSLFAFCPAGVFSRMIRRVSMAMLAFFKSFI